ncbi:Hypothetical_protein [Hexamita inflata]
MQAEIVQIACLELMNPDPNIDLAHLLKAVEMEAKGQCDQNTIHILFEAIKTKNPEEIIKFLNENYKTLKPPLKCKDLQDFKNQLEKCIEPRHFRKIQVLLHCLEDNFTDFNNLCSESPEQLCKDYNISLANSTYLLQFLAHYKQISIEFQIDLTSPFKDISKLDTAELLYELEINKLLTLNQPTKNILLNIPINQLINKQILFENRRHKECKYDISINSEYQNRKNFIFTENLPDIDVEQFNNACTQYALSYDSILCFTVASEQEKLEYVGWQKHWETVIDFVENHILGDTYQTFDLLCILGGPKTGKTASMYLTAVFMLNFVPMIRPQSENTFFSQQKTKLIRIDCKEYGMYELHLKLEKIYYKIEGHLPQTQKQLQKFQLLVNKQNISEILGAILDMLITAHCYLVITWDEIQNLNFFGNIKISDNDEYILGCFYKSLMVSQNSPCQHLMSASFSVALLTILKAVPENGRSILRCKQSIVTSWCDDQSQLKLIKKIRANKYFDSQLNVISISKIFNFAVSALLQNKLPITCANLNQILNNIQTGIANENIEQQIEQEGLNLLILKSNIAIAWIDNSQKSIQSIYIFKRIANLIGGTSQLPPDLLVNLCYYDSLNLTYKFRDNSILNAINQQFQNKRIENLETLQIFACIKLQNCGNLINEMNNELNNGQKQSMFQDINKYWYEHIKVIELKLTDAELSEAKQFKHNYYCSAVTNSLDFQMKQALKKIKQNKTDVACQNVVEIQEITQIWNNTDNESRNKKAQLEWESNGVEILSKICHDFCHHQNQESTMKSLEFIIGSAIDQLTFITALYEKINAKYMNIFVPHYLEQQTTKQQAQILAARVFIQNAKKNKSIIPKQSAVIPIQQETIKKLKDK